ncbi:hypothetical protein [Actinomadura sp. 3N508]|uniref:hypothetical protein n=1 Tax=Actinomadura sp. 3N508 TaxID=3375153 RepID=UPI00379C3E1D
MNKSMQQQANAPKRGRRSAQDTTYKRLADHRQPLPETVVARCADTSSSHGFRTV